MALLNNDLNEDIRAEKIFAVLDKEEQVQAPETQPVAPIEVQPEITAEEAVDTGAEEIQPTVQEDGSGEPAKPVIEPPKFLKADMRDKWKSLPTDWQQHIVRQAEEDSRTVSTKLDEAAAMRRQSEAAQKAAEEKSSIAAQEQQRYVQQLGVLAQMIEGVDPVVSTYNRLMQTGELAKLGRENPAQYAELDAAYKARMKTLQQVTDERNRVQNGMVQEHFAREERALIEKLPDWSDPVIGKKGLDDLRADAIKHYGFKPEELVTIPDHRYVLMARDAAAYRALKAQTDADKATAAAEKAKAEAAIAAKRAPTQTRIVKPNPSSEGVQVSADRNKALLKQARGARNLADKAAILAGIIE